MAQLNVQGGSQGEPTREFKTNFFHSGVKAVGLSNKVQHRFRILPAFDRNQFRPEDPGFRTSFIPYRDRNLTPDADTKTEGFTDWYYVFQGHNFLGKGKRSYISPLTVNPSQLNGGDPLLDCFFYCKKHQDPRVKALVEKPKDKSAGFSAIVTSPKSIVFFNGFIETSPNVWESAVVYCTNSALGDLKTKLALRAGRNDAVISPEWPDYIYGDVTHPTQGLMAVSRKTNVGSDGASFQTACIFFSNRDGVLDGANGAPFDPATPQGQAILAGRYNLLDSAVTKVASYEEILEYIVADGTIPYEIIHAACSPHVTHIPAKAPSAQVANAGMPPADDDVPFNAPAAQIRPTAPAPVAAPFAAPAAAPFAPAPVAPASTPFTAPVGTAPFAAPAAPAFTPPPAAATPAFAAPAAPPATPFGAPAPAAAPWGPSATPASPFGGVTAAPGTLPPAPGAAPQFGAVPDTRVTTALAPPSGAAPATPQERARFDELTQKIIASGGKALSDVEMRELGDLSARVNAQ